MKPYKITIFIFSVIILLTTIAAIYPAQGIVAGDLTLNFPTLTDILTEDTIAHEPSLTPEQLLAMRAEEIRRQQEEGFLDFLQNSDAAIRFPVSDTGFNYFNDFYDALDGADTTLVRIVHYGDSQIEEDRISNVLRRKMQEQFGGQGVGILPMYQTVQSQTVSQSCVPQPQRYSVYWLRTFRREGSRRYGPMGQMALLDSVTNISVLPRTKTTGRYSAHLFNTVTLISSSQNIIYVNLKGKRYTITPDGAACSFTEISLPDSTSSLTMTLSGKGDIYGIMFNGKTGVNVDNMPMRGCSGTIFTGIESAQLKAYFSYTNTRLIILQFGGNSMPYLKTDKAITTYAQTIASQVRYMQAQAPEAKILFVGPSDMTTRIQGKMQTYTWLEQVDDALAEAVTREGVAYWSMFKAMGGKGAMGQWVRSGLAGNDYIHFTRRGADEVGNMLYNAIIAPYNYYKWKQRDTSALDKAEPEINNLTCDTINFNLPTLKNSLSTETINNNR